MRLWIDHEAVLLHKTGLTMEELKYVWSVVEDTLVGHYVIQHEQRKPPLLPFESLLATLY
jgi:hypothetical protein